MSLLQHHDRGEASVSPRVLEKVRSQFPGWAAATRSRGATAADDNGQSEFLLASNWMLRSEGLAELSDGLEKDIEGVQITYDSRLSSLRIRCLASEEDTVMAKCQSLLDKIVQRELKGGLAIPKHVTTPEQWREGAYGASQSEKKDSVMALAPSDIRGSVCRTAWIMPDSLAQKGIVVSKLITSKAFAKLQHLTGCTMMISSDGLSIHIGAKLEEKVLMAERKLTTLAKYAAIPSEANLRCESFIYAEDQQGGLAKFTYMVHGAKQSLKTFFLDRMIYSLAEGKSAYGSVFEKGVVVTLSGGATTPTPKGIGVTPAILSKDRDEPYKAFSSEWRYKAKEASSDAASSVPFDPNPRVTSWITKLPTPELMLPHGDEKNTTDPDSGISNNRSKIAGSYDGERDLTQKEIHEQQSKLLPHQISQVIPTLPKSSHEDSVPLPVQEVIYEQRNRTPHQVNQAPNTVPELKQEEAQKTTLHSSQEGMSEQQRSGTPRGAHATTTRVKRGNTGRRQGGRRQNGRQDQRRRSNRGRRPYQQRPTEQRRMNSRNATGHVANGTPARFPEQSQAQDHGNTAHLNTQGSTSARYVPPHLRYLHPVSQTSVPKQASQETPEVREGILIVLDSDESDHEEKRLEELRTTIDKLAEETTTEAGETNSLSTQSTAMPANSFVDTWNMHCLQQCLPSIETDNQNHGGLADSSKSPTFHSTMRQQASARTTRRLNPSLGKVKASEDPAPQLIGAMSQKIVRMMSSLEVFHGRVSLKAEIGRFCLTKINRGYVQAQGQGEPLQDIKVALDKHHTNPRDVMFTNVLTAEGADANYIAFMKDSLGKRIWTGDTRRTVYEITCCALTADNKYCRFVIEVDGDDFTCQVRPFPTDSCSLFVHCPKRSWDFKVALAKSQDLGEDFAGFAKDLIRSMRVAPQPSGVPFVEFTIKKAYNVEMLALRTRNIASYTKFNTTPDVMEICEVHDMGPSDITEDDSKLTVVFQQRPAYQQLGQLGTWYEVSMQSKTVNKALQQNRDLELGEEVDWSPEKLQESGAFDELIRSTMDVVKNIDGVGYWGDNYQDTMIHGMPLTGSTAFSQMSGTAISKLSVW
ncbi:uncharacterized protein F4807DRAFT_470226 [Annulohypoxylon truncatum]|uniref:uncharacterized protein n=1 Tax=Annulohypoxylon truncatum TaxID=327061 RepID=UPI002007AE10|nr:uncharacterized protein F4807DRAFT_470226 [Annulohypoxylon truncatum]KAI1206487.1 hypothetical protein F4807DRAFT_470226 [Annulohypoxylon truncatum]